MSDSRVLELLDKWAKSKETLLDYYEPPKLIKHTSFNNYCYHHDIRRTQLEDFAFFVLSWHDEQVEKLKGSGMDLYWKEKYDEQVKHMHYLLDKKEKEHVEQTRQIFEELEDCITENGLSHLTLKNKPHTQDLQLMMNTPYSTWKKFKSRFVGGVKKK